MSVDALVGLPKLVVEQLESVATRGASDLHVVQGIPPRIRHGGVFKPDAGVRKIEEKEMEQIISWAGGNNKCTTQEAVGCRWRVTTYRAVDGWRSSFRLIPSKPPAFKQLGLPEEVASLSGVNHGLIITAGATGSGKTTTLASLISEIVRSKPIHLLTIEEPVEFQYESDVALVTQRELGDELDSQTALEIAMRSDIDVVLFGEIRNPADAELCLELASSGHLVLTTIHANDAGTVCERFESLAGKNGRSVLAQVLKAIITQKLLPSMRNPTTRFVAAEVLMMDNAIRTHIRPRGDLTRISGHLRDTRRGMDVAIAQLIKDEKITRATGLSAALEQKYLEDLLMGGSR